MKKYLPYISGALLLIPFLALAQDLPPGTPVTFDIVDSVLSAILNFLLVTSGMIMAGAIIISGIMMVASGGDKAKYEGGLKMLKSVIWGSFVILGSVTIINIIKSIVSGQLTAGGISTWAQGVISAVAGFIMFTSGTVMVIGLVISGMMMIRAGGDKAKFETGFKMLKNVVGGAFVILGSTTIIAIITSIVTGTFTFAPFGDIISATADFIIVLSGIWMVIYIVISGMMIMSSRDNPEKYKNAVASLKNTILGSFVVLGSGVIINTIWAIVTRDFFCQLSIVGICLFR